MGIPELVLTRWIRNGVRPCPPLPIHCPAGPAIGYLESLLDNLEPDIAARTGLAGFPDRPEPAVHAFEPGPAPAPVATLGDVAVESVLVDHGEIHPAIAYRFTTPDGVVVVSGDTRACNAVENLAAGADILVHEVLSSRRLLEEGLSSARVERLATYHAEAPTVGALAARADVKQLVLTHLMPAPRNPDDTASLVADVRSGGYDGDVVVASDLYNAAV